MEFSANLEAVKGPVYGLTYERGDTEIFMAGYKLAAAKLTASSALGCLATLVEEPEDLGKVNVCDICQACCNIDGPVGKSVLHRSSFAAPDENIDILPAVSSEHAMVTGSGG